jgi:hypothetical protein
MVNGCNYYVEVEFIVNGKHLHKLPSAILCEALCSAIMIQIIELIDLETNPLMNFLSAGV